MSKKDIITKEDITSGEAYKVKNDLVIESIIKLKKFLGTYQGNELYVAKSSLEEYKKKRKEFEQSLIFTSILIALIWLIGILSIFNNLSNLAQIFSTILMLFLITFLLIIMIIFTRYIPNIEEKAEIIGENNGKENNNQS